MLTVRHKVCRNPTCSRDAFDHVVAMRVEGVSISAIARISRRSRSTIERWFERAASFSERFNNRHLRDFEISELQADELCTFVERMNLTLRQSDCPLSFREIFGQSDSSRLLAAVVRFPIRNAMEGSIKAGLQLAA